MAQTFFFYNDSGLTSQFDPASGDKLTAESDGGSHDFVLYLGSTDSTRKIEASSNPGVDQITLTPADASPGSGHEASEIKLALSLAGLDTATGGAALNIGTVVNGGAGNAVPIYIRLTDAVPGTPSSELSIEMNEVVEKTI